MKGSHASPPSAPSSARHRHQRRPRAVRLRGLRPRRRRRCRDRHPGSAGRPGRGRHRAGTWRAGLCRHRRHQPARRRPLLHARHQCRRTRAGRHAGHLETCDRTGRCRPERAGRGRLPGGCRLDLDRRAERRHQWRHHRQRHRAQREHRLRGQGHRQPHARAGPAGLPGRSPRQGLQRHRRHGPADRCVAQRLPRDHHHQRHAGRRDQGQVRRWRQQQRRRRRRQCRIRQGRRPGQRHGRQRLDRAGQALLQIRPPLPLEQRGPGRATTGTGQEHDAEHRRRLYQRPLGRGGAQCRCHGLRVAGTLPGAGRPRPGTGREPHLRRHALAAGRDQRPRAGASRGRRQPARRQPGHPRGCPRAGPEHADEADQYDPKHLPGLRHLGHAGQRPLRRLRNEQSQLPAPYDLRPAADRFDHRTGRRAEGRRGAAGNAPAVPERRTAPRGAQNHGDRFRLPDAGRC